MKVEATTEGMQTVYYHEDRLGSTTHLTDVNGTVVERYRYNPFGSPFIRNAEGWGARTESAYNNRFLYTGREWLAKIGLYDYRNRAYSPNLGRFMQPDPIGFDAGDVNIYRYVGNNAVNAKDPDGLKAVDTVKAVKEFIDRHKEGPPDGCDLAHHARRFANCNCVADTGFGFDCCQSLCDGLAQSQPQIGKLVCYRECEKAYKKACAGR